MYCPRVIGCLTCVLTMAVSCLLIMSALIILGKLSAECACDKVKPSTTTDSQRAYLLFFFFFLPLISLVCGRWCHVYVRCFFFFFVFQHLLLATKGSHCLSYPCLMTQRNVKPCTSVSQASSSVWSLGPRFLSAVSWRWARLVSWAHLGIAHLSFPALHWLLPLGLAGVGLRERRAVLRTLTYSDLTRGLSRDVKVDKPWYPKLVLNCTLVVIIR